MKQADASTDFRAHGLLHLQGNLQQNPPPSGAAGKFRVAILFLSKHSQEGRPNFFWKAPSRA
jgi:hypothetical protein